MITGLILSHKVSLYLPEITGNLSSEARDTLSLSPIPDFCTYGADKLMGATERGTGNIILHTSNIMHKVCRVMGPEHC